MAILKVQPNAVDTTGNFAVGAVTTTGNVTVGGQLIVNNIILPTTANVIDIGSPTMRFGALYLAGNTIDIGGTLITTSSTGDLEFTTQSGNIAITANTVSFLSSVANTASEVGNVAFDGNVIATAVYTDNYFYANGAPFTGLRGYSGSAGTNGYVGSRGDTGLGFTIAKSYASVAALTADSSPTAIVAGQFALIETGSVNDTDNSKLYLWTGSAYSYVNDLSGAAGITGPAGYTGSASSVAGYTGSAGSNGSAGTAGATGYTGSTGAGYTGSAGTNGYTGSQGSAGNTGTTGYTGSSGAFSGTTSSAIVTTNSTSSTSVSTGALQVSGGAGIAGNVYAGAIYTNGLYWSGNGVVMSTGGGSDSGGYLNMVMAGAVLPPISGTARMYPPADLTITKVMANLSAPPSNGNLTFVIKKNGSSLGATYTLSTALMDPVTVSISLTTADYLTIDIFGSTTAADLHIKLKYV
jgi:hypothetical protein